jgi:hypothetical protein
MSSKPHPILSETSSSLPLRPTSSRDFIDPANDDDYDAFSDGKFPGFRDQMPKRQALLLIVVTAIIGVFMGMFVASFSSSDKTDEPASAVGETGPSQNNLSLGLAPLSSSYEVNDIAVAEASENKEAFDDVDSSQTEEVNSRADDDLSFTEADEMAVTMNNLRVIDQGNNVDVTLRDRFEPEKEPSEDVLKAPEAPNAGPLQADNQPAESAAAEVLPLNINFDLAGNSGEPAESITAQTASENAQGSQPVNEGTSDIVTAEAEGSDEVGPELTSEGETSVSSAETPQPADPKTDDQSGVSVAQEDQATVISDKKSAEIQGKEKLEAGPAALEKTSSNLNDNPANQRATPEAAGENQVPSEPPLTTSSIDSKFSQEELSQMRQWIERGNGFLERGDLITARQFYKLALKQEHPEAYQAMGRSYDPRVLNDLPVLGMQADPDKAQQYYDKAEALKE